MDKRNSNAVYNHLKCLALFKAVVSDPNDHIPYVLHLRHPGTDPEIVKLSTMLSLLFCRVSVGNSPFLPRESFVICNIQTSPILVS